MLLLLAGVFLVRNEREDRVDGQGVLEDGEEVEEVVGNELGCANDEEEDEEEEEAEREATSAMSWAKRAWGFATWRSIRK